MAAGAVDLPDGFVLDGQSGGTPGGMPDGFVLDKSAANQSSPMNSLQDYGKSVYGWNDYPHRATFLPMAEDDKGDMHFAMPQAGVDALNSVLLPGFAAKGGKYNYGDTLGLAAMISPMSPAARAGELTPSYLRPGTKAATPEVPSTDELRAAASTGYDAARDMGVTYSSPAVKNMADTIEQSLNQEGRIGELNPELFALVKKLQNPPDDSFVTLDALQALRRRLGDIAGSGDRSKSAAASIAIDKLDDFLERGGVAGSSAAGAVVDAAPAEGAAAAEKAASVLKDARGNSAAAFRADRLATLGENADLRADATNSGRNLGNTIRQRLASLLASDETRGYSPEELDAMRSAVQGTPVTNGLRTVSNQLGGGGGIGQTLVAALGAGVGSKFGPEGAMVGAAIPTAVGTGARALGNKLTRNSISDIEDLIRQRSPLYASRVANPGTVATYPVEADAARRLALMRALQGYGKKPIPVEEKYNPDIL